jgi:hypothetical protein
MGSSVLLDGGALGKLQDGQIEVGSDFLDQMELNYSNAKLVTTLPAGCANFFQAQTFGDRLRTQRQLDNRFASPRHCN